MPAVLAFIMGVCVMGLAAAVWTNRLHDQLEQERARKTPAGAAVVDAFSRHYPSRFPHRSRPMPRAARRRAWRQSWRAE